MPGDTFGLKTKQVPKIEKPKYRYTEEKRKARRRRRWAESFALPPKVHKLRARDMPEEYVPVPLRIPALKANWTAERIEAEIQKAFAYYFTGNVGQTLRLMLEDGWQKEVLPQKSTALAWLWLPEVQDILESRLGKIPGYRKGIATREELQIWWTSVIRDEEANLKLRLKASEYLAKSHAMFIDRHEIGVNFTLADLLKETEEIEKVEVEVQDA